MLLRVTSINISFLFCPIICIFDIDIILFLWLNSSLIKPTTKDKAMWYVMIQMYWANNLKILISVHKFKNMEHHICSISCCLLWVRMGLLEYNWREVGCPLLKEHSVMIPGPRSPEYKLWILNTRGRERGESNKSLPKSPNLKISLVHRGTHFALFSLVSCTHGWLSYKTTCGLTGCWAKRSSWPIWGERWKQSKSAMYCKSLEQDKLFFCNAFASIETQ